MKALLGSQDVWEVIELGYIEHATLQGLMNNQVKELKESREKNKTALYLMYQAVDESGFEKIAGAKTTKEAWETLEKAYKGADRVKQVRLQTLRGEFETLRMKELKGVSDYITRVEMVVNQLKRNGEEISENRVVEKILRLLTNDFENVVCAIEESKNLTEMTVDELSSSLEAHEQRKKKKKQEVLEEALQAKATLKEDKSGNSEGGRGRGCGGFRGRGRGCGRGRGRGQEENKEEKNQSISYGGGRGRGRGRSSKYNVQCYSCKKYGHYAAECYYNEKKDDEKKEK
jgi:gag-polypeptide of LTR copia-type